MSCEILVVRLGAMGDIVHTLPAAASLKCSNPDSHLTWVVDPRWAPLLDENPFVDHVLSLRRETLRDLRASWRCLRARRYDFAVDFQGLLKSALIAKLAGPRRIFGYHRAHTRESSAALFYSDKFSFREKSFSGAVHRVDKYLELAAIAGASTIVRAFPLPAGHPEGDLPKGDFVLASPLAGWRSKQWPLENYRVLAKRLASEMGVSLVFNGPASAAPAFAQAPEVWHHFSGLPGLIDATRRATAVIGVDSGPSHIAAALGKPGVAVFGPTDPTQTGPYGGSLTVLYSPSGGATYQRRPEIDESMRQISPNQVFEALRAVLGQRRRSGECLV
jgi:heptosyltransferase I